MKGNGKSKFEPPIRLSPHVAARNFGVRSEHIKKGLIREQISPGVDGKFSLREIFRALHDLDDLEQEAKRARFQAKIDDAAFRKLRLQEKRNDLMSVLVFADRIDDLATTWFSALRHSSMSKREKEALIAQCVEIANRKFPDNDSSESRASIRRQEARAAAIRTNGQANE